MMEESVQSVLRTAIGVAVQIAAPVLLLGMGVGILISIFQAATQISEQTITFVPKLIVIALVLLIGGSWMMRTLVDFTHNIFKLMEGG